MLLSNNFCYVRCSSLPFNLAIKLELPSPELASLLSRHSFRSRLPLSRPQKSFEASLCVNAAVAVRSLMRLDETTLSLIALPRVARYRGLVADLADGLQRVTRRGLLPMHFK